MQANGEPAIVDPVALCQPSQVTFLGAEPPAAVQATNPIGLQQPTYKGEVYEDNDRVQRSTMYMFQVTNAISCLNVKTERQCNIGLSFTTLLRI